MSQLLEILGKISTGELTLAAALIAICCFLCYFFYKEIKQLNKNHIEKYDEIYAKYHNDQDKLIKQMFEAFNKNTEAQTKLADAVRDLSTKI